MIPVGEPIQVIGYLDKRRLNSRVLGWVEGEYIVISYPSSVSYEGEEVNLPKDAAVVCRGIIDGRMYGFKTHVLHWMSQPFEYLFLVYPSRIEDLSGSKGFRLDIEIPASGVLMSDEGGLSLDSAEKIDVIIQNLSASGAVIRFPEEMSLESSDAIILDFQLPDGKLVKNLRTPIRKDIVLQDNSTVGVQFNDEDPKFGPVFDFLLLANKIISQSEA